MDVKYDIEELVKTTGKPKNITSLVIFSIIFFIESLVYLKIIRNNPEKNSFLYNALFILILFVTFIIVFLIKNIIITKRINRNFVIPMNNIMNENMELKDPNNTLNELLKLKNIKPGEEAWNIWKLNVSSALIDNNKNEDALKLLNSIRSNNQELMGFVKKEKSRIKN